MILPGGVENRLSQGTPVEVVYPRELGAGQWPARHARGEVPSRWPYGLDGLAAGRAGMVEAGLVPRPRKVLTRLLPRGRAGVSLTWEENTAVRMAQAGRHGEQHSGVIWATSHTVPPAQRWALRRMDSLWVLSEAQVEPVQRLFPRVPVTYVRFGIDAEFFSPTPYPDRPLILSIGVDRHRDPETTAEAFRQVLEARPRTLAVIQHPRPLQADPRITVVPRMSHAELRDLYGQASVVAVATRENDHVSGMTVALEAAASARPVVMSRSPGLADYVPDGQTGLIVPRYDASAMAEAVIALLDDADTAAALGTRGRARVEAVATTEQLCDRLDRLVLGGRP